MSENSNNIPVKEIVEGAIMAAGRPMSVANLIALFPENEQPEADEVLAAVQDLQSDYDKRGVALIEVASGFRFQVRDHLGPWVSRLWDEKPARYSRAFLETLALVAYRQPTTRGQIEEVRGVAVSSHIMKSLLERGWVRIVGHRDVPGKPALFATTKQFLDDFNLKSLSELPSLAEITNLEQVDQALQVQLDLVDAEGKAVELQAERDQQETSETETMTVSADTEEATDAINESVQDIPTSQEEADVNEIIERLQETETEEAVTTDEQSDKVSEQLSESEVSNQEQSSNVVKVAENVVSVTQVPELNDLEVYE